MKTYSAKDARQNFGEMMDIVQQEPVSIEKHGRPVAVMISDVEYEGMKLQWLREKLAHGAAQADRGEFAKDSSLKGFLDERKRKRELVI